MKRYILFVSFLAALTTIQAQETYRSVFGEQQTSFNVMYTVIDAGNITDSFYYAKDTLLETVSYKQFLREPDYIHGKSSNKESFLLRENEDHSQVFLRIINGEWPHSGVENESKEYLIMDMNLNKQDSFVIKVNNSSVSALLIVDSVYFDDEGRKHIRFDETLMEPPIPFEFIEGVGTNMGVFYIGNDIYHFTTFEYCSALLLCAHQDEKNTYTFIDPKYWEFSGKCSYRSVGSLEEEIETLKMYPVPARDFITIELGDDYFEYQCITIFDMLGAKRIEVPVTQRKKVISTQTLDNGYYSIHINSDKKICLHKKLLIVK